jgi:molybdate transport system substrate-binding protein
MKTLLTFVPRTLCHGLLALVFFWPVLSGAETALIAVASNFSEVAESLVRDFENLSEHEIEVSAASTGKHYAQIINGAPYDALLAADQASPRRLEKSEIAVAGTRFVYAIGRLTLWSPDEELIRGDGIAVLEKQEFRALAIANPALAPYGIAAKETLLALGLWNALEHKIVMGENIGQAFALAATGNAELGLVAVSSVISKRNAHSGSRWDVPLELHSPIRQDAVLLEHGYGNAAAVAFLAYLQSDEARLTIESFGYGLE